MKLELKPTTLRAANDWLDGRHRHNTRTVRNGGRFAIQVVEINDLDGAEGLKIERTVGVAIVGNPLSATFMDGRTAEVLRLCTEDAAPKNVCSMLYSACWRAWRAMGGDRMVTYTLQSELGTSLLASGWVRVGQTRPTKPGWRKDDHLERIYQPVMGEPKDRWEPAGSRTVREKGL